MAGEYGIMREIKDSCLKWLWYYLLNYSIYRRLEIRSLDQSTLYCQPVMSTEAVAFLQMSFSLLIRSRSPVAYGPPSHLRYRWNSCPQSCRVRQIGFALFPWRGYRRQLGFILVHQPRVAIVHQALGVPLQASARRQIRNQIIVDAIVRDSLSHRRGSKSIEGQSGLYER